MGSTTFPWELLKAESLRSVCRDVGHMGRTRDAMIDFLKTVETLGLKDALNLHSEDTRISVKATTPATLSTPLTPKRSREPVVSDYNTRHRDKRVRLSDPGPGASRKKVRVLKKVETKQPQTLVPGPSRNLRELKSAMKKNKILPTKAARREVFDGVLLRKLPFGKGKGRADDEGREDATSNGSDEVLSGLEGNGLPSRDESSLADSNKENESIFGSAHVDDENDELTHVNSGDAEGVSQPTQRGIHDITPTVMDPFDDDPDAEGEVVVEHEDGEHEIALEENELTITVLQDNGGVLRDVEVVTNGEVVEESEEATSEPGEAIESPAIQAYQHPDIGDLTTEDVSHIEQLLKSVVENKHTA